MKSSKTIRLGKSGLEVTRIGFGGIPIQRLSEQQAIKVLRRALEGGFNWIDTANDYGNSEERIGKAIKKYPRSDVLVFTKGMGRDPKALREQIELSFERLQTDYVDLYQFHIVPDQDTWRTMLGNGAFDLVRECREKGKIRSARTLVHAGDPLQTATADGAIQHWY